MTTVDFDSSLLENERIRSKTGCGFHTTTAFFGLSLKHHLQLPIVRAKTVKRKYTSIHTNLAMVVE